MACADSLVWKDGLADWQRADAVAEVAALLTAAPDAPTQPVLAYQTPQPVPGNGMAVASLVLGIVSIPTFCIYGLGIIASALAIVFGFIALGRAKRGEASGGGMALAGIICAFTPIVIFGCIFLGAVIYYLFNPSPPVPGQRP